MITLNDNPTDSTAENNLTDSTAANNPTDSTTVNNLTDSTDSTAANNPANSLYNDPNAITVNITDPKTPIIVLYGPPSCGKTMTLIRLARYLKDNNYMIKPDRSFRDSNDTNFQNMCDSFDNVISNNDAAKSTNTISFMLIKVLDKTGHPVCQILEAPGEGYFVKEYPPYVHKIINCSNRKIWAVFVEPNWADVETRRDYVDNIRNLNSQIKNKDKILFVYNKIDKTNVQRESDTINEVMNFYPGIFEPFLNQNPISKFWRKYNCKLVRFQTGTYSNKATGGLTFTPSDDAKPRILWENLIKLIKG